MFYPAFLNLNDKTVIVIGGGEVAERKVELLLECGASITVISPVVTPQLESLAVSNTITLRQRRYEPGDCAGAFLVFSATDDRELHKAIHDEAVRFGAMVNTVDEPDLCDFISPAVLQRGDLTVAISTNAKSPGLAAHLRRQLVSVIGPEYGDLLELLAEVRPEIGMRIPEIERRKAVHYRIIESGVLELLRRGDRAEAQRMARQVIDEYVRQGQPTR